MADTTNPVSPEEQTTPVNETPTPDLLGDISLDIPAAPEASVSRAENTETSPAAPTTETVDAKVSDLGDIMLEGSLDATQQKAESIPAVSEDLNSMKIDAEPTPAPAIEMPAAPEVKAEEVTAPTEEVKIDLPEAPAPVVEPVADTETTPIVEAPVTEAAPIETPAPEVIAENVEPVAAPTPAPVPAADPLQIDLGDVSIPTSTDTPASDAKRVFKPLDTDIAGPTATPDTNIILNDIPAAPVEATPTPETPAQEVIVPTPEAIDMPILEATKPVDINAPVISAESVEPVVETAPAEAPAPVVEAIPEPIAEQPSMMEQLTANEKAHIEETPAATESTETTTVANETTLDLDSLTEDIAAATAGTPAPTPAAASVNLPIENTAILKPHKSIKKKVFVSLAGFVLLAVVTGLVAKVMFPIESQSLLASITGGSETTETPILIDSTLTETPVEVVTETPVDTGAINNSVDTGTETIGNTDTQEEMALTAEEAEASLNIIADESRKNLAVALKTKNKTAEGLLYKTFKDSSALLETLANTADITTMTSLKEDIETLQKDLTYATSLLDETGTQTESQ